MDTRGNGGSDPSNFLETLRGIMRGWGWTPEDVEGTLPKVIDIFVRVGILRRNPDGGYEVTEHVEDEDAWNAAWAFAEKEGIGRPGAS
jgi:hypothetical protein